jgi:CheY-like chemotaxis protein
LSLRRHVRAAGHARGRWRRAIAVRPLELNCVDQPQLVGIRVLVVEDHDDSRDVYDEALQFCGATVTTARTAREALAAVAEVDIIVTDLFFLGGENGLWLLDQVNARPQLIPVIVVAGVAEADHEVLRLAPFALKLLKPVDPLDLARHIAEVLRGRW